MSNYQNESPDRIWLVGQVAFRHSQNGGVEYVRAATSPDTPSDAAIEAAKEISSTFGLKFQRDSLHRTAAIIMRYCATTSPTSETAVGGRAERRNEDGELTSVCKHCGQPISQTVSTGSWYHDSGWSRMCTRLNAAPVPDAGDDEGEGDARLRLESTAEPWICAEEKPCEEAVPVHWNEMITALAAAALRSGKGEGK